jgi:CCR4-NOT transcription complex subunit 3
MEKFKACEREMKTKQYSKEGLQARERMDPNELAKLEMANWITTMVDTLGTQVDSLEAESELINANKGRRGVKVDTQRLAIVEHLVDRHKFHMGKLELMLRMLENDTLAVDEVCI